MADPEISARAKSKRKRGSALLEPEDVTADILDELQRSRKGIDKKLAKYNDAIMQIQVRERQQFIEKCATRIRNLHDSVRPIVVVQLLSSEDFAVEMNFSELHTSSSKSQSLLTWSCTDGTLSESSWKTVLQQCAEDAPTSSSRTTRASSKGTSPHAPPSTPIKEPPGYLISMASSKTGKATGMLTEHENKDEDAPASSDVTMSKHGKARIQKSPAAPLTHGSPSTRERQAPATRETWGKRKAAPHWSQKECDTLRNLCYSKAGPPHHITLASPLWEEVSTQMPGRTKSACFMKWREMRRKEREGKAAGSRGMLDSGDMSGRWWSDEELTKLAQCCSQQPQTADDWAMVAAQFPGRTSNACEQQYRKRIRGVNFEFVDETRSEEVLSTPAAVEESAQGNLTPREGEGDD